jgi:hypothetical protein
MDQQGIGSWQHLLTEPQHVAYLNKGPLYGFMKPPAECR